MFFLRHLSAALLALAALLAAPTLVHAETFNTCAGFITTLPATISTQGVWCLDRNLSTDITFGNAITIAANNVTIDCNDFKIGGLAAGTSSRANGIQASNRQNATVRHCAIRGFYRGIVLVGNGVGHLVEDNRLDNNLFVGINVTGDNNRVRRNAVYDTGGSQVSGRKSYGISADADVIDNTVAHVFNIDIDAHAYGIHVNGDGHEVRGNRVRRLSHIGGSRGVSTGIHAVGSGITLTDNRITRATASAATGIGIRGYGINTICVGNTVHGFTIPYSSCDTSLDNASGGNS